MRMQSSNEKQNEELKEFVINQEKVVKLLNAGLSSKKKGEIWFIAFQKAKDVKFDLIKIYFSRNISRFSHEKAIKSL